MPTVRANGIILEYESFGGADGPAILLIMGVSSQLILWPVELCEGLAANGFRVIRFDNRDVGKSTHLVELGKPDLQQVKAKSDRGEPVAVPYTLEDMGADVVGLLDGLGIDAAHIVGASMGGMIAQIVAARYPSRVLSLTSLMSTSGRRELPQADPEVLSALLTPPRSSSREDLIEAGFRLRKVFESPAYSETPDVLRAKVAACVDRVSHEPTGPMRQLAAVFAAAPRDELLGCIRCPSLVIHGEDDPLIPVEAGRDTARCIPGSELVVVPGMAHDLPSALMPVLLEHLVRFLGGVHETI